MKLAIEPFAQYSHLTFVARPVSETRKQEVLFGLHTAQGCAETLKSPIPFVRSVVYTVNGHDFAPFDDGNDLACAVDCSKMTSNKVQISAIVTFSNGTSNVFNLMYQGEKVSTTKSVLVNHVEYSDVAKNEIELVSEKANDWSLHQTYVNRADTNSWFMIQKKRHYLCTICGTEQIFRGGMHWKRRADEHVRCCIAKQFSP